MTTRRKRRILVRGFVQKCKKDPLVSTPSTGYRCSIIGPHGKYVYGRLSVGGASFSVSLLQRIRLRLLFRWLKKWHNDLYIDRAYETAHGGCK